MLIDWFTVGAQILNFLILVGLLKHFLYKPILDAIDAREKRIAAELADADAKRTEAQRERDDFQKKNEAIDGQRSALLANTADEAKAERERMFDSARKEAELLRAKQETALRNDRLRLAGEITRLARDEVFAITRKALADLATTSLEERMGEVFTRRLREMNGKAKEALSGAMKAASGPVLVRSAFDLGAEQRAQIQNALNEDFSADVKVRFEVAPGAICGIEMTANGQKVGWSIAEYLALLEQKVGALVDAESPAPEKAVSKPSPVETSAPEVAATAAA